MISMAVASSTYLTLLLHLAAIPFTRMQKSRGASLVPCGVPPLSSTGGDKEFPILTRWLLFVKKAAIHLTRWGSTSKLFSSLNSTLWSTRSKPLLKFEKKILMHLPRVSSASKIVCIKKITAWVVERPGRANCLVLWLSERSVRWVSSHFLQTLEVEALELGPQWLASVALGSNLVPVTSCRYPPELGKAQRRILSIQQ